MEMSEVSSIIFDLGGVIIDINPDLSFQKLSSYYQGSQDKTKLLTENVQLFLDFEKGLISSIEFRNGIRHATQNPTLSDTKIDTAWNSMLLKIPLERLQLIEKLSARYQLLVLSNTNAIHVPAFNKIVDEVSGRTGIHHFFDKVYFSHEMLKRKPEAGIYRQVLDENALIPKHTLFVDDRTENIEAARSLGLQTFHVTPQLSIIDFFDGK